MHYRLHRGNHLPLPAMAGGGLWACPHFSLKLNCPVWLCRQAGLVSLLTFLRQAVVCGGGGVCGDVFISLPPRL